jgi:hypothetical protein
MHRCSFAPTDTTLGDRFAPVDTTLATREPACLSVHQEKAIPARVVSHAGDSNNWLCAPMTRGRDCWRYEPHRITSVCLSLKTFRRSVAKLAFGPRAQQYHQTYLLLRCSVQVMSAKRDASDELENGGAKRPRGEVTAVPASTVTPVQKESKTPKVDRAKVCMTVFRWLRARPPRPCWLQGPRARRTASIAQSGQKYGSGYDLTLCRDVLYSCACFQG